MAHKRSKNFIIIKSTIITLVIISLALIGETQQAISTTIASSQPPPRTIVTTTTSTPHTTSIPTTKPLPIRDTNTTEVPTNSSNQYLPTTTAQPVESLNTTSGLLLSKEEFVDFTETPTLLFDGISNENNTETTPKTTLTSNKSESDSENTSPNQQETRKETIQSKNNTHTSNEAIETTTNTSLITTPADIETNEEDGGIAEEDEENSQEGGNAVEGAKDQPFSPPQNVSQYMDYIERLFHDFRHQITDLFEPHIPQLIRTSRMVQLSGSCSYDMLRMALALRQFEPWALRMIDSSGKVPEGILEGSFTALGSYDECLNIVFGSGSDQNQMTSSSSHQQPHHHQQQESQSSSNIGSAPQEITQGKYCLVNVSPYLPPKPHADRVERLFQDEANRRNYTKDDQFSRLSGMFYYMKFRIGICIPSTCLETDLHSISSALSSNLRLNITIPHCRVREQLPVTKSQLFGGLSFGLVLTIVLIATVMDCSRRRKWRYQEKYGAGIGNVVVLDVVSSPTSDRGAMKPSPTTLFVSNKRIQSSKNQGQSFDEIKPKVEPKLKGNNFAHRLDRHWSWLSFSLLTNYKLYFTSFSDKNPIISQEKRVDEQKSTADDSMVIRCLNGIRVLSLCWVIVANSYVTLDPRATKRLVQTREAPKDFLFQMVAQASLAIETFFFLSGILMSLSFSRKLKPEMREKKEKMNEEQMVGQLRQNHPNLHQRNKNQTINACPSYGLRLIHFYIHRYIRMTPATMLVIAFTMFAYSYGDGPLWFEATHKAHQSCSQNWWRHLLHIANYIDTRQMCFIHYWYIAADMQLFLFAPLLLLLLYKFRLVGYLIVTLIGVSSIGSVFYTTYSNNLPPTLLFYNSDPESRREFGNTIMTKPLTHALPYIVGMLVGKWLSSTKSSAQQSYSSLTKDNSNDNTENVMQMENSLGSQINKGSLSTLFGLIATIVALAEVFLPYKWNNSHLPTRLLGSVYAALFRFAWSLVLAYLVISCRHKRDKRCRKEERLQVANHDDLENENSRCFCGSKQPTPCCDANWKKIIEANSGGLKQTRKNIPMDELLAVNNNSQMAAKATRGGVMFVESNDKMCMCGSGGGLLNCLLSLNIFTHLSKLSFVAYLIHLPLMSVFVAQTRGLFAFSHTLVIHLALSYLMMTFILSFILVHIIEFPFITFERYLFKKLFYPNENQKIIKTANTHITNSHNSRDHKIGEHISSTNTNGHYSWKKQEDTLSQVDQSRVKTNHHQKSTFREKKYNYTERL